MAAPHVALCVLLALTCARAGSRNENTEIAAGCTYGGRWYAEGAAVRARDACLRCRCARGALSCARAACAPAPDPPPSRCALLHRRDACCPELHCPDGVKSLELEAAARREDESWDVALPGAVGHACVEEGAVFAAGSALTTRAACEQCFCLRGVRRCVRPRCLPPPPACAARPAPGACCPSRYYCEPLPRNLTSTTTPPMTVAHRPHDCEVDGKWVREGEPVSGAADGNCTQCFCLRGGVRCQPLTCAPTLRGCRPLLRAGQCCPHQYHCPHHDSAHQFGSILPAILDNYIQSTKSVERSFRRTTLTKSAYVSGEAAASASPPGRDDATTKVKRKTSDPPPAVTTTTTPKEINTTSTGTFSTSSSENVTKAFVTTTTSAIFISSTESSTEDRPSESTSTDQPEDSMKIIINGTINCTAELSSKLTNITLRNETVNMDKSVETRTAANGADAGGVVGAGGVAGAESSTLEPTEIITDRSAGAGFEEGDSFIVNVTSSLNANSTVNHGSPPLPPTVPKLTPMSNISKKTKENYDDYDYMEPTLPPSLPNLKIIPFVAADAVVDEDVPSKESDYPVQPSKQKEDKFPVYYPTVEHQKVPFATRREDVYGPTQYPVFVSEKASGGQGPLAPPAPAPASPPPLTPAAQMTSAPTVRTTQELTVNTPEVNLFSPPAETEGGFIPKGPGIIDEYYAVYPSTPPPAPHLTTSMQIEPDSPDRVECLTPDGRRVPSGESVRVACSVCACAWGELHCAPRRCAPPPPACARARPHASSGDLCCGDIVCRKDNGTTAAPLLSTRRPEITSNETEVPEIESHLIPFDPPPDRREPTRPPPHNATQTNQYGHQSTQVAGPVNTSVPIEITINTSTSLPIGETKEEPTTPPMAASTPPSTSAPPTPPTPPPDHHHNDTATDGDASSEEYEDEDEGFSFGSVLKLLLSDNYDSTTVSSNKKPAATSTTTPPPPPPTTSTTRVPPRTTRRPLPKLTPPSFVPVQPHAYIPPKKLPSLNAVERIDHLVLGEATAIRRSTVRPSTAPAPPPTSPPAPPRRTRTTTRAPPATAATTPAPPTSAQPAGAGAGAGAGLLKLAGCNIYGRMYRVGRIIAELSTPCQECRCTELGVQCQPLRC